LVFPGFTVANHAGKSENPSITARRLEPAKFLFFLSAAWEFGCGGSGFVAAPSTGARIGLEVVLPAHELRRQPQPPIPPQKRKDGQTMRGIVNSL